DGSTLLGGDSLEGTVAVEAGNSLTALSYSFDGGIAMPIAFDATGAFDQALDLSALARGNHTLALMARDAAGNNAGTTLNVSLPAPPPLAGARTAPLDGPGGRGAAPPARGTSPRA